MSHTLFRHSMLCNALVWAWLHKVDEAEASRCREAGCRHCPGKLHSTTYPRKPYGLAAELRDEGTRRFSFCCADCRLRATPPSVRFFGRRFYLGALFVLVSALVLRGGVRLQTIKRRWGIPVATLRRWRTWWLEAFPATEPWGAKRGELVMPSEEAPLLFVLGQMQGGRFGERLLRSLIYEATRRPALRCRSDQSSSGERNVRCGVFRQRDADLWRPDIDCLIPAG